VACACRNRPGDLAVAAALASSFYDKPLPADAIFLGEVGLGGEIRGISQAERTARKRRRWECVAPS
jgi:predicted ATP-dependent serine protease